MNYVKQAFSISDETKKMALEIYKESVKEMVHKKYRALDNDAHVELSAIFGIKWMAINKSNNLTWASPSMYAKANIAFNYANFPYCKKPKFIELAKELVVDAERVKEVELDAIASQMNCILTATTTEKIMRSLTLS